jgi:hypothetical protein
MNSLDLAAHLLNRLHEVQARFGVDPAGDDSVRFADALDSMGMVEFLGQIASDCSVEVEAIERAANRRFGTVAELARAMRSAHLAPNRLPSAAPAVAPAFRPNGEDAWLAGTSVRLGAVAQPAEEIDALVNRPRGWFRGRAGIEGRRL